MRGAKACRLAADRKLKTGSHTLLLGPDSGEPKATERNQNSRQMLPEMSEFSGSQKCKKEFVLCVCL